MTMESLIAAWGLPALTVGTLFEGDAVAFVGGLMAHRGLVPLAGILIAGILIDYLTTADADAPEASS